MPPAMDVEASDDDVVLVPGAGVKRGRGENGTTRAGSSTLAGDKDKNPMGNLPATLGEGEHEKPMMEGILVALRELAIDVQDLKGALYVSWELERDNPYILEGQKMKEHYQAACRQAKGTGTVLGHMKNYCMVGLYAAAKKDPNISAESKATPEQLMGHLLRKEGRLTLENALAISPHVAYCQVVRTKKKGFINILLREGPGKRVMEILAPALDAAGKRQTDAGVPKPIFKEIKDTLLQARGKGKGGGKGSKGPA